MLSFFSKYPAWAGRPGARSATIRVDGETMDIVTFGYSHGAPYVRFTGFDQSEGMDGQALARLAEAMKMMINHVASKRTGLRLRAIHDGRVDASKVIEREEFKDGEKHRYLTTPIQFRAPDEKRLYISAHVFPGGAAVIVPPMAWRVNQDNVASMAQFEHVCGRVADWVMKEKKKTAG